MAFLAASSFGGSFATKGLLKHNEGLLDYIVDETLKTIKPLAIILYNVGSGLELCVSTCNLSFSFASSFKEGACCSCHTHTSNQFQFFI